MEEKGEVLREVEADEEGRENRSKTSKQYIHSAAVFLCTTLRYLHLCPANGIYPCRKAAGAYSSFQVA